MSRRAMRAERQMESIVPKGQMVAEILDQLEERIPDFDRESVVSSLAILDFAQRVMGVMDTHFSRYDLSQGRFTVLMFLLHFPDTRWTPATLAEAADVRRPTMTGLVANLERHGWIVRTRDPDDGRRSVIALSDEGRRRMDEILPDHFGRFAHAMQGVDASTHDQLRRVLDAFGDRVGSVARHGPAPGGPTAGA